MALKHQPEMLVNFIWGSEACGQSISHSCRLDDANASFKVKNYFKNYKYFYMKANVSRKFLSKVSFELVNLFESIVILRSKGNLKFNLNL